MELTPLIQFLYFCIIFVTTTFILDFIFYKIPKIKPVIYESVIASDFDRCKWLFDEIGLPYKLVTYKTGYADIYLYKSRIAFDEKHKLQ